MILANLLQSCYSMFKLYEEVISNFGVTGGKQWQFSEDPQENSGQFCLSSIVSLEF